MAGLPSISQTKYSPLFARYSFIGKDVPKHEIFKKGFTWKNAIFENVWKKEENAGNQKYIF
jgi:hypothetical protein